MIDGVVAVPLKPIPDERGSLMEILRSDDPVFRKFGQVYCTTAYPGVVKGWHQHKKQWDNFVCLKGMIQLVCYDDRPGSKTRGKIAEYFLGPTHPIRVTIPPLVWHGFKGIAAEESVVVNVPTELYRHKKPDEYRRPWNDPAIPYDWERRNG